MKRFHVICDRSALVQYLRWELGHRRAVAALREGRLFKACGSWFLITSTLISDGRSRRAAKTLAERVRSAADHADGRRGQPLRDHCIAVVSSAEARELHLSEIRDSWRWARAAYDYACRESYHYTHEGSVERESARWLDGMLMWLRIGERLRAAGLPV